MFFEKKKHTFQTEQKLKQDTPALLTTRKQEKTTADFDVLCYDRKKKESKQYQSHLDVFHIYINR